MSAALVSALLVVALGGATRLARTTTRAEGVTTRLPRNRAAGAADVGPGAPGARRRARPTGDGPRWLPAALAAADVGIEPSTVWASWCVAAPVAVIATLMLAGPALAVAAGAVVGVGPVIALRASRGRASARVEADLPAALEAVARSLRTGASLRQAVAEAAGATPGALGDELQRVTVQARRGVPLVQALENLAERRPLPGVRLAVAVLCLGAETGGAQAQAVDGVATTLRDRLAVVAEVRALSSQARTSAVVISLAPIGFGAFAAATDPRIADFLYHSLAGGVLLAAGGLLDGLGWLWMNRLARVTT